MYADRHTYTRMLQYSPTSVGLTQACLNDHPQRRKVLTMALTVLHLSARSDEQALSVVCKVNIPREEI